jgi:hypothetical protein
MFTPTPIDDLGCTMRRFHNVSTYNGRELLNNFIPKSSQKIKTKNLMEKKKLGAHCWYCWKALNFCNFPT